MSARCHGAAAVVSVGSCSLQCGGCVLSHRTPCSARASSGRPGTACARSAQGQSRLRGLGASARPPAAAGRCAWPPPRNEARKSKVGHAEFAKARSLPAFAEPLEPGLQEVTGGMTLQTALKGPRPAMLQSAESGASGRPPSSDTSRMEQKVSCSLM